MYDVERFGIVNSGNPKHADVFVVTGSVNEQNMKVVQEIYSQMLEPKVVVACGICACSGGIFKECYNTLGGVDLAIPVDVYAPGCAVRPETLIDAVVAGLGVLEEKRAALLNSRYKILLADSTKFNSDAMFRTCALRDFDAIYTNAPDDVLAPLREMEGVRIFNRAQG